MAKKKKTSKKFSGGVFRRKNDSIQNSQSRSYKKQEQAQVPVSTTEPQSDIRKLFDKEPIINVLLYEYQVTHNRVFKQISQYEDINVKILMLVGVLLFFGISFFSTNDSYINIFVNATFIIALPIIAICSVLLALADLVKVMILGDYLKIIENKIDTIFEEQARGFDFPRGRVLDWEYWRVHYGHAHGIGILSEISFSMIVVILIVFVSFYSALIRLNYIRNTILSSKQYPFFNTAFILLVVLFALCLFLSIIGFAIRRRNTLKNSENDKLTYE